MASPNDHDIKAGEPTQGAIVAKNDHQDKPDGNVELPKHREPKPLGSFPEEILSHIAVYLDWADIINMRVVNKHISHAMDHGFVQRIGDNLRIYARYESVQSFLNFLEQRPASRFLIKRINLIGEGFMTHEWGSPWGWENIALGKGDDPQFKVKDRRILNVINAAHHKEVNLQSKFLTAGTYRTMLTQIFKMLPNLQEVTIGKLKDGEHIPGWVGPELVKRLSFYNNTLQINKIFYHDWQYDEKHLRMTSYVDEMGWEEEQKVDDVGPQARFIDDFEASMKAANVKAKVITKYDFAAERFVPAGFYSSVGVDCNYKECDMCVCDITYHIGDDEKDEDDDDDSHEGGEDKHVNDSTDADPFVD